MQHPGPWQHFVKRPDNNGLDIMACKHKYLLEDSLYERKRQADFMFDLNYGGGAIIPSSNPSPETSFNSYVEDDYIDDYFI
jgi:hypothetical protein